MHFVIQKRTFFCVIQYVFPFRSRTKARLHAQIDEKDRPCSTSISGTNGWNNPSTFQFRHSLSSSHACGRCGTKGPADLGPTRRWSGLVIGSFKRVFALVFGFRLQSLKVKNQTKMLNQENSFFSSKSLFFVV